MSDQSKILGLKAAALLGPLVALGAFQFAYIEPANAFANYTPSVEFDALPIMPDYESVSADSRSSDDEDISSSPFWYEVAVMQLPQMPSLMLPDQVVDETVPDPVFVLTSVLPSATKSLAVINGTPCSEGAEVLPGWVLVKISGKDRYVILKHTSGKRLRVLMKHN